MKPTKLINKNIENFYATSSEADRLKFGLGPLEHERCKELILRYVPKQKSTLIDVGGGPGIYSEWLAKLGHEVHLIEPVPKHIEQATKRSVKLKNPFKVILGEARHLDLPDAIADVIILHGPLYHLQLRQDRIKAIAEALRVVKPGGYVLGFAINRPASTLAGLLNGFIYEKDLFEMCKEELTTGLHHPPANMPGILAEAYFHEPEELQHEFETAGIASSEIIAVEGCVWMDKNYFENKSSPDKKKLMTELLWITEKQKSLLSFSPHMMIAAKK